MRVLMLGRYGPVGASTRVRMLLYRPALEKAGIELTVSSLLDDDYVNALYAGRQGYGRIMEGYMRRIATLLHSSEYDLIWLEKEALPWLPAMLETAMLPSSVPLVVDYDDAIFHRYDQHRKALVRYFLGRRIDKVMARADLVVAGNAYLASRARKAGAKWVEIIPTVVDLDRYHLTATEHELPIVGWIGSPATQHLLAGIAAPLSDVAQSSGLRFVAIGARKLPFAGEWCSMQNWSEDTEAHSIANIDIGVMPLPDLPWERGKCGYKLIQYMAAGKPVIASPVGVNIHIVRNGENGFLANTDEEWAGALRTLIENPALRQRMGRAGRRRVEEEFCLSVSAPKLVELLLRVGRR